MFVFSFQQTCESGVEYRQRSVGLSDRLLSHQRISSGTSTSMFLNLLATDYGEPVNRE